MDTFPKKTKDCESMEKAENNNPEFFSQIEDHKERKVPPIEIKCIGAEKVKVGEYVVFEIFIFLLYLFLIYY